MTMLLEDTAPQVREHGANEVHALHPDRPGQKLKTLRSKEWHRSCVEIRPKLFLVTHLDGTQSEWEHHGATQDDWCSRVRMV